MAAEELLRLFDEIWSERPIFKKNKNLSNQESEVIVVKEKQKVVKNIPVRLRAMSDETMTMSSKTSFFGSSSSSNDLFSSPRSVLNVKATPMKLQTILSGKEVNEFTISEREKKRFEVAEKKKNNNSRRRRRRKGKSMSDLEYEELKGFMDLGFVLSEEDHKDSYLVSIIPGLQSLMKKDNGVTTEEEEGNRIARPYLSEAWESCGGRKGRKQSVPEIKWRIPVRVEQDVDLKDHMKQWVMRWFPLLDDYIKVDSQCVIIWLI